MVDQLGGKPLPLRDLGIGRIERTVAPRAAEAPVSTPRREPSAEVRTVASQLSASPPVDNDKVARIRKAITEGRFPITPATIADNLLALKLDWAAHDQA